jgi:hypothetical protein
MYQSHSRHQTKGTKGRNFVGIINELPVGVINRDFFRLGICSLLFALIASESLISDREW